MTRPTPASRALIGCLALRDGATTNQAFRLAGYTLLPAFPGETDRHWADRGQRAGIRNVVRRGRFIATTGNATHASEWLTRLGRKLEALGAGSVSP